MNTYLRLGKTDPKKHLETSPGERVGQAGNRQGGIEFRLLGCLSVGTETTEDETCVGVTGF